MNQIYKKKLLSYIHAYENLTEGNLNSLLLPVFAENAYFEDPFNQVVGKEPIRKIFQHMFDHTISPRFVVMNHLLEEQIAFLYWEFCFLDRQLKEHRIVGVSKVVFDYKGQVLSHIDYWDSGKYIYQKIPVLKSIIRWVNRFFTPSD